MRVDRIEDHSFLVPLPPDATVVDLGANRGNFAATVVDRYGARVYAVEPDPRVVALIPEWISRLEAAVGRSGTIYLHENRNASTVLGAADVETAPVATLSLTEVFEAFGLIDVELLKVDVEGAEFDVLADPAIRRCRQVTVEFHDFLDPDLRPRVEEAWTLMRKQGFHALRFSRDNTDVLFTQVPLTRTACLRLLLRFKFARGGLRWLRGNLREIRAG